MSSLTKSADKIEKKWRTALIINLIVIVWFGLVPYIFAPCSGLIETAAGGTVPMKCHWFAMAERALLLPLLGLGLTGFFLKQYEARQVLAIAQLLIAITVLLLPQSFVIGVCANTEMACNTTKPMIYLAVALIILSGIYQLTIAAKQKKYTL